MELPKYVCHHIGVHGNLFGGTMMSWIDEAEGVDSTQICDTPRMVTVKISELIFKKPINRKPN